MKSNRSAKKNSKQNINKSFKASKLDHSLLLEEPITKKTKRVTHKEPVHSHRSNASNKVTKVIGS